MTGTLELNNIIFLPVLCKVLLYCQKHILAYNKPKYLLNKHLFFISMNIVIVGAGRIGKELMNRVSLKGNNIVLVEKNEKVCQSVSETTNSLVINADGTDIPAIKSIDMGHIDFFVAATGNDSTNLTACLIAKKNLEIYKSIAIVNDHQNSSLFRELGIDIVVDIPDMACGYFESILNGIDNLYISNITGMDVNVSRIMIKETSPVAGKPIKSLNLPDNMVINLIVRNEGAVIPRGDTVIMGNDAIFVTSVDEKKESIQKIFLGKK